MEAKGFSVRKRFALRKDGEVDRELLEVMRVMMGPAEVVEEDEEDEHAQHEKETREIHLEMDVLGTLGQMMEDKLVKLSHVPRDSPYVREDNRRNCEVYRRGESWCDVIGNFC